MVQQQVLDHVFSPLFLAKRFYADCLLPIIQLFSEGRRDDITDAELWRAKTMLSGQGEAAVRGARD